MASVVDLTGRRFGRLTVIERAPNYVSPKGSVASSWHCACDCGVMTEVLAANLRRGASSSCGCLAREMTAERKTVHGAHGSPEYRIWAKMLERCSNPNCRSWRYYGARGIKVCAEWRDFSKFLADMGPRPSAQHSIERRNNNAGYSAANCCWATRGEQARNKRTTVMLTAHGMTRSLPAWADDAGMDIELIRSRLGRGWAHERAIFEPKSGHSSSGPLQA